ncbi:MAG: four helix bundle protein [Clostridia bacterium]|nr:four helix bundle protein [Clostridia bacterium]
MADSALRDKSKEFAKEMVFVCRDMKKEKKESVLINQVLRSATSVGANIHEAQYAQGTKDFISKFEIAQKECYETEYWLELLYETDCLTEEKYKKLHNECGAIRRMLISSMKTIKANNEKRETKIK